MRLDRSLGAEGRPTRRTGHGHVCCARLLYRSRHPQRQVDTQQTPSKAWQKKACRDGQGVYWTLGQFDLVRSARGPTTRWPRRWPFSFGGVGNMRTQTLRAFFPAEMGGMFAKMV